MKKNLKSQIPRGVKAISIIEYIESGICLIMGSIFAIISILSLTNPSIFQNSSFEGLESAGVVFLIFAIILIAISVALFFIARGLWKGKNWARTDIAIRIIANIKK